MGTLYDTSIVVFLVTALICTDSSNPHWQTVMDWASGVITCIALAILGGMCYAGWTISAGQSNVLTQTLLQYTTEICAIQIVTLWLVVPVSWVCQRNNNISRHWKKRKVYFMGSSSLLVLRKLLLVVTVAFLFSSQLLIGDAIAYFITVVLPSEQLTHFAQSPSGPALNPAHVFFTMASGAGYAFITNKMLRY